MRFELADLCQQNATTPASYVRTHVYVRVYHSRSWFAHSCVDSIDQTMTTACSVNTCWYERHAALLKLFIVRYAQSMCGHGVVGTTSNSYWLPPAGMSSWEGLLRALCLPSRRQFNTTGPPKFESFEKGWLVARKVCVGLSTGPIGLARRTECRKRSQIISLWTKIWLLLQRCWSTIVKCGRSDQEYIGSPRTVCRGYVWYRGNVVSIELEGVFVIEATLPRDRGNRDAKLEICFAWNTGIYKHSVYIYIYTNNSRTSTLMNSSFDEWLDSMH